MWSALLIISRCNDSLLRYCLTGWWFEPYPSEKYYIVSCDDDIPNIWKVIQNSMVPVTTNQ